MADNSILTRLDGLKLKYEEIGQKLTDPEVIADVKQFIQFNKEYRELEPIIEASGTLPHGHRQPDRSQRHPGQRQGRGDARNGTRGDRGTGTEDRNPRRGDQTPVDSQGPAGCQKRDRRDPRRHGRRRSRHLRRRPDAHVHQIHRIQRLEATKSPPSRKARPADTRRS